MVVVTVVVGLLDGDLAVLVGAAFRHADGEGAVGPQRRGGGLGVDAGVGGQDDLAVERQPAAGEAQVEPLAEVTEPVDPDLDGVSDVAHLDVAGGGAGGVEHREVGVVALEQVDRQRSPLLDPARRPAQVLEDGVADRAAQLSDHSSTSERQSTPPQ